MLSLQDLCLNVMEEHDIPLERMPIPVPSKYKVRHPVLQIKINGHTLTACGCEDCDYYNPKVCVLPPLIKTYDRYLYGLDITVEYNGKYKLTTESSVLCCGYCKEHCWKRYSDFVTIEKLKKWFSSVSGVMNILIVNPRNNKVLYGRDIKVIDREFPDFLIDVLLEKLKEALPEEPDYIIPLGV